MTKPTRLAPRPPRWVAIDRRPLTNYQRYTAFRAAQPRPPHLTRHTVRARGLDFAVWTTPTVRGAVPLCCINGGLIFSHRALWPTLSPLDAVGTTGDWLPGLHARALERLLLTNPAAHADLAAFDPMRLAEPDVAYHARYTRAFSPAWFVDQTLAPRFAPPNDVSVTGVTIAARLRRELYRWSDVVAGIRAPVLLIHGDGDVLDPAIAHATARVFPSAATTIIHDAGHMPFWEAPAEFFAAVQFFLDTPTLPTTDG